MCAEYISAHYQRVCMFSGGNIQMANIRIERVPIEKFYLGYLGFDHLQLVFEQDSMTSVPVPQEGWYVMEGLRVAGADGVKLGVLGDLGKTTLKIANGGLTGDALEAAIGTPEARGSRIISVSDPLSTWTQMSNHAAGIADQYYDYNAYGGAGSLSPTLNSTSFIASALYAGGISITQNLPNHMRYSPGMETLLGGNGDDLMRIQNQFTAVFGGYGQDLLRGLDDPTRIDRMYGGADNDLFSWSQGKNYLHGGDSSWTYAEDGLDTVNYAGAGSVHIELVSGWVEHKTPQYIALFNTGIDYLLSIERLVWDDQSSDTITTGPGVELIETPLSIYMGGESANATQDTGDTIDFSASTTGLIINRASDSAHFVSAPGQKGEGGLWIDSVEWVIGSSDDDKVYANEALRGIEGGEGADFIDAHLVGAFSGASPNSYDVEIDGGSGADTIIANAGRTFISGGAGADMIVASAMTSSESKTEMVIENADSSDRLYVAYNYFNESALGYKGSKLMQLTGAIGTYDDMASQGWELFFATRLQADIWTNTDELDGVINFAGLISYRIDGSDLIITLMQGERFPEDIVIDDTGETEHRQTNLILTDTETTIRVVDFQLGDFGLQFIDPGNIFTQKINGETYAGFDNWDAAVFELNKPILDPFPDARDAPASDPNDPANAPPPPEHKQGTDGPDLISLNVPTRVDAGDGNDTVTSTGNNDDIIDGGAGDDTMSGGEGNDHYYVDSSGDLVIESQNAGTDTITSSVDYTLAANVENLTLANQALIGTGNWLANRIVGNGEDNTLIGLDGNDTLFGGAGNDILIGGEGSDVYSWVRGDGNDTVIDTGTGTNDIDTLFLFQDVSPDDLSATRLTSQSDDMILIVRGGGQITLADAFTGAGIPIEQITFETGVVWTTAELSALAQSAALIEALPPDAHDDEGLVYGGIDNVLGAEALLANDIDPSGADLAIQSVFDVSIGSATVTSEGNIAMDLPPGYEGQVRFRYTVANQSGATASALAVVTIIANAAPVLAATLPDQVISAGETWSFALPDGLFTDADGDTLAYFATLADGSELPSWLTFNRAALTFTGTPPAGTAGPLALRVEAYDGFVVSDTTLMVDIEGTGPDPDQTFAGTSGDDTFIGGSGNDTFTILGNGMGHDILIGGAGTDTILGSAWNDTLGLANIAGNLDGIEVIDLGGGHDTIALTSGDDHLDLSAITVTGVELIDAGAGNDTVIGSAGNDVIRGNAGNDLLIGGEGDDTFTILGNPEGFDVIQGGPGTDTILGSGWNDTLGLANIAGNLDGIEAVDLGGGYDKIALTGGNDHLDLSTIAVSGVELIDAGAGNDTVIGSAGNDMIRGNAGDDLLIGGDGDDTFTILGNPEGFDVIQGGSGTDTILGSAWNDTLGLANIAGNLDGIEAIDLGGGYDTIALTGGNDTLDLTGITVSGVELIDAGAGNDIIVASAANDILMGGDGNDTFEFRSGFGHDTIVDFETGTPTAHDVVDLADAGLADYAALLAAASEANGDTLITLDASQSLTLVGVSLQQLTADHFLLA